MKITSKASLDAAIRELEQKRLGQEALLKQQFRETRESLNPVNLLKNGFNKFTNMPDFREGILKTIGGLGAGVLSKKLFLGSSPSIIKKILSNLLEVAVAKSTISNADRIKALGISLYHNLFKKNSNHHPRSTSESVK